MGFGVPVENWMRNDPRLRERLEYFLSSQMLLAAGFRDVEYVRSLLRGYLRGRNWDFKRIWLVYAYMTWFKKWAH